MTHPKGLIQGSIDMGDIPDAKRNGVGIYAGILEGQLLGIPCHPMQGARLACSGRGMRLHRSTHRDSNYSTC